ncbi:MAG: D-arabinono-1,4-lactone oxidase [Rhodoglobus sp.]
MSGVRDPLRVGGVLRQGGRWRNWGRSQQSYPEFVSRATSVGEVVDTLAFARDQGLTVRPIGAGHSFTAIAATDGVQLDISAIDGVLAVEGNLVTLGAGTNLYQLPALLGQHGLALENMGDIDRQTIAGAISTGTHGTGARFGGLAAQVEALTLVTADGGVLRVSATENAELLPAARLGLGALGILVDVTLRCVPHYMMHALETPEPLEAVLDNWVERATAVDHFEFYWFPHTTSALTKTNIRMPGDTPPKRQGRVAAWIDDELLPNGLYRVMCELGVIAPATTPPLNRLADKLVAAREVTDGWHAVLTSPRRVRFREMEYAIPRDNVPAALRAVRELIDKRGWRITFPVEVRVAASDANWLSTAQGRETGYIAVHRYYREDPTEYFTEVEAIMRDHDGRPHWGKMHNRTAADLRPAYPHFDDFLAARDRLDPDRLFANEYLTRVLGS